MILPARIVAFAIFTVLTVSGCEVLKGLYTIVDSGSLDLEGTWADSRGVVIQLEESGPRKFRASRIGAEDSVSMEVLALGIVRLPGAEGSRFVGGSGKQGALNFDSISSQNDGARFTSITWPGDIVWTRMDALSGIEQGFERSGGDLRLAELGAGERHPMACRKACESDPMCVAFTYLEPAASATREPQCQLKDAVAVKSPKQGGYTGILASSPYPCTPRNNAPECEQYFEVLTYNTHLFDGSAVANLVAGVEKIPLIENLPLVEDIPLVGDLILSRRVFYDVDRAKGIAAKVIDVNADVVLLQEVWSKFMQDKMKTLLQGEYPYIYVAPDSGFEDGDSICKPWPAFIRGLCFDSLNEATITSGLFVASKHPIVASGFEMFAASPKDDDQFSEDRFAKKGVAVVTVRVSVPYRTFDVRIGNTHAFTEDRRCDKSESFRSAARAAQATFGGRNSLPRILAGDLNVHVRRAGMYRALNDVMAEYGALDLVDHYYPAWPESQLKDASCTNDISGPADLSLSYTVRDSDNTLKLNLGDKCACGDAGCARVWFGECARTGEAEFPDSRLDYIYFSPAQEQILEPRGVTVFHDWTLNEGKALGVDLSDHYPVYAKFAITGSQGGN